MSKQLDMQNFLKTMNDDEMYICINEVIYTWNGNNWTKHSFNPLSFDVVKLPFVDAEFQAMVDTTSYLAYSFRPVITSGDNTPVKGFIC